MADRKQVGHKLCYKLSMLRANTKSVSLGIVPINEQVRF